jgi:predicted flap endonuclease-1-like 5' DNA nuclease
MFEKIKKFIQEDLQKKYEQLEQRFLVFEQKVYSNLDERMKNLENQFDYISEMIREKYSDKSRTETEQAADDESSENDERDFENELTLLNELGKKMEIKLNSLGIYSLKQIAELTEEEVEALDLKIPGFKIRFQRNDWRDQAVSILNG